jgi:ferredoxin
MSFDFDPFDPIPLRSELEKIDKSEKANEQQRQVVIRIDHDLCEATGVCAEICPENVIEHVDGHTTVTNPGACTECWICVENCVSGAIEIG